MKADRATRVAIHNTIRVLEIYEQALQRISEIDGPQGLIANAALVDAEAFFNKAFGVDDEKSNDDI